ncbi:MAG: diguanylate cyclase [Gammaproteobacteria bacterium]
MHFILFIFLLLSLQSVQAEPLRLVPGEERYAVGRYLSVWEDPSNQRDIHEVQAHLDRFVHLDADKLTRGTSQSAWWLLLPLRHELPRGAEWLLSVDFSTLDHLDVWQLHGDGRVEQLFAGGDRRPFHERLIRHSSFLVPLTLQPGEESTLLIRAQTIGSLVVPVRILSKNAFIEDQESERLLLGGLWGGLLFLMLYNLLLYLNVRDQAYLYYCAYIFTFVLCTTHMAGIGFHYLWPDWIWFQSGGLAVLFMLSGMAANHFTRLLLELKTRHPLLDRILWAYLVLCGVSVALFPLLPYALTLSIVTSVILTMAVFMLASGLVSFIEGYPPARYYFLAWVTLFVALGIFALEMLGFTEGSYLSKWALQIGAGTEALLFAIAMSDRINLIKQQALEAREKVVEQEKLLRSAQEQANRELEARVEQRTRELARVAEDLARVNEKLDRLNQLDELTQVYNRRAFNQRSVQLLMQCQRERKPLSVLLLDVDHFKQVNDRYGHLAGDECLRRMATLIRERVTRPQDFVARFGGEEFVVVLFDTHLDGARHVAERIRSEVQQLQVQWETTLIPLTTSIGLCSAIPDELTGIEQYTAAADQALYEAKESGRNRVVVATVRPTLRHAEKRHHPAPAC